MQNLIAKTIGGMLFLAVVLGLAIFIPAGSLSFWQGWLFLATFFGCTILITLYLAIYDQNLLTGRVEGGPAAEVQKSQQVIQGFASLFFIALMVVPGLDYRFHWSNVPPVVSYISAALVALGFYFVFLVFRANTYTAATIKVDEHQTVISTGPYGVVRHPMYASAAILLIATSPTLGSWWGIPFAILLMVVIGLRAVEEEKFLAVNLTGYDAYRQKVRYRLIPFVW